MKPSTEALLRRAGVKLPEPPPRLPKGTLIVAFVVPARPVPWKAPFIGRNGGTIKDASLITWQSTVKLHARRAMGRRASYPHPVELILEFHLAPIKGRTLPDTSNLTKGCEDALQCIVIDNDKQVSRNVAERRTGLVDEARIWVFAMEDM